MTTIDTEIKFDRMTKDFSCYVDGRYVGSRPSYSAGEQLVTQVARDLIIDGLVYSATELDADPPAPEPPIVIVEAPDPTPPESRYTRDSRFDKRGNPYDADAWRDAFGLLRWVAVGTDPNVNNPIRV